MINSTSPIDNIGFINFGIEITDAEYTLFTDKHYSEVISLYIPKPLITKQMAITIARNICEKIDREYVTMYISKDTIRIDSIRNIIGEYVFNKQTTQEQRLTTPSGWLVFVDLCNVANWGHSCKYIFIVDETKYYICDDSCPPANVNMEEIMGV